MPLAGFEPAIPTSERPQIDALDGAATGIGMGILVLVINFGQDILNFDWCSAGAKVSTNMNLQRGSLDFLTSSWMTDWMTNWLDWLTDWLTN
jgi:hypothetical protein